jgi:hypothetical protein
MSIVKDTVVVVAATGTIGIVLIGGIYYLTPSWQSIGSVLPTFQPISSYIPSMDQIEEAIARLATSPVNIAARAGSQLGDSIMKASGYTYTASELQNLRKILFAEAKIPNTPANASQRLYEVMVQPGQTEQLERMLVDLIGIDIDWNIAVSAAYFVMYESKLDDDVLIYDL